MVTKHKIKPGSKVRVLLSEGKDGLAFESPGIARPAIVPHPTVLIVDDNRDFLRLLSLELSEGTRWGMSTAQSVAEAERIGSTQTIDFALLDLILPDGNGIELGARLREQQPEIHVAIRTGGE